MAKKKRRRRPSGGGGGGGQRPAAQRPPQSAERTAARRERKEEAREARQAALRRFRRQRVMRRAGVWAAGGVAVVLVFTLLTRNNFSYNHKLAARANKVALAAGCTGIETPPDLGHEHLSGAITYDQQPPTSGSHNPNPLNGGVYPTPQKEENMVHSLEHGAVEIYYAASGPNALPQPVVNILTTVARGKLSKSRVIMTPAPETLSAPLDGKTFGVGLAFAGWNRLRQCPSSVSPHDAKVIAQGFMNEFVNAPSAREAGRPI